MLSALTKPNYPKAALGLEQSGVTALALQKEGRGQYSIKQAATVELPKRLLTPNFVERNIADSVQLNALIDEALINAGMVNQKNWSVALPSNSARTGILTLENEPVSKQELEAILDWKSEQVFGAPAGEMRISRQKISPDSEGKARYFATAVKLSIVDEYETLFESKGWKAGLILPRVVSEANWLMNSDKSDSLLISSQFDGFTALLIRGNEPTVVRNVTCQENERDDEIFRLLMFYRDRLANEQSGNWLEKILVIGKDFVPQKIREISVEALGQTLKILRPEDVGLNIPASNLSFDDIAAPAGLAALGV
ncbi:MAG: hypothetical protein LUM44_02250 [Pyrinomonadaceae bacterium]|nr:hypothetical protein [Pyrinomonadaceae bacterium]